MVLGTAFLPGNIFIKKIIILVTHSKWDSRNVLPVQRNTYIGLWPSSIGIKQNSGYLPLKPHQLTTQDACLFTFPCVPMPGVTCRTRWPGTLALSGTGPISGVEQEFERAYLML